MTPDLDILLEYCETQRQREVISAVKEGGTQRKAAELLGVHVANVEKHLRRLRQKAASAGYAPEAKLNARVPPGYRMQGYSTLTTNDAGEPTWLKAKEDRAEQEALFREAAAAMAEALPREKNLPKAPKRTNAELCSLYVITDYHIGMLSWPPETGAVWDTDIAEETLIKWFSAAIAQSPASQCAVLAELGDFLHWDGLEAVTPANRHVLDSDTRFAKVVKVAIRVLRRVVKMLLAKHQEVHIVLAEGNHDPASSAWLREMFSALYEGEDRVTVDPQADIYYCFEWGATSLFFHHGHKRGVKAVDTVLAGKFRAMFGRTKHSYAHLGHLHHRHLLETNLMVVEQHRTLAAADSFASRGGWIAGREAQVIHYHTSYGEVGRHVLSPEAVGAVYE